MAHVTAVMMAIANRREFALLVTATDALTASRGGCSPVTLFVDSGLRQAIAQSEPRLLREATRCDGRPEPGSTASGPPPQRTRGGSDPAACQYPPRRE